MRNITYKIIISVTGFLLLALFSSCVNLPGKEQNRPDITGVSQNTGNTDELAGESGGLIVNESNLPVWTEPEAGPTVTPIVLMIEKRGEEGAMIIRSDDYSETEYDPDYEYEYESDSAPYNPVESQSSSGAQNLPAIPTAANYSSGALKDEMEVARFAPFSGSVVLPNQALHLDITLRNSGTTTWQESYKVVDYSNMAMTVQHEYNLPYAVAPGNTVLLSVYMKAPQNMGSYPANFQIQDSYGVVFGQFEYILTVGAFSSITEIPTLTPSVTPTYYSADGITATPDSLAWMCIDPERSKRQDCYQFCVEYSHREEFKYCFYNGERYTTPVP